MPVVRQWCGRRLRRARRQARWIRPRHISRSGLRRRVRPRRRTVAGLAATLGVSLGAAVGAVLRRPATRIGTYCLDRPRLLGFLPCLTGSGFWRCRRRGCRGDSGLGLVLRGWFLCRVAFRPQIPALGLGGRVGAIAPTASLRRFSARCREAILWCVRILCAPLLCARRIEAQTHECESRELYGNDWNQSGFCPHDPQFPLRCKCTPAQLSNASATFQVPHSLRKKFVATKVWLRLPPPEFRSDAGRGDREWQNRAPG